MLFLAEMHFGGQMPRRVKANTLAYLTFFSFPSLPRTVSISRSEHAYFCFDFDLYPPRFSRRPVQRPVCSLSV